MNLLSKKQSEETRRFQTLFVVFYGFGSMVRLIWRSCRKAKGNGGTLDNSVLARMFLVKP